MTSGDPADALPRWLTRPGGASRTVLTDLHAGLASHDVDLVVAGLRGSALDAVLCSELAQTVGVDRLVLPTVRTATGN